MKHRNKNITRLEFAGPYLSHSPKSVNNKHGPRSTGPSGAVRMGLGQNYSSPVEGLRSELLRNTSAEPAFQGGTICKKSSSGLFSASPLKDWQIEIPLLRRIRVQGNTFRFSGSMHILVGYILVFSDIRIMQQTCNYKHISKNSRTINCFTPCIRFVCITTLRVPQAPALFPQILSTCSWNLK